MDPVYALTVYEADDTTPLFTISTDPGHTFPYLKAVNGFPEQEVDLAKSAASIGQVTVTAVDVPTDPADQTTGYITSQLPDSAGYSALTGHRALLTEDRGSGVETVMDGVVSAVRLLDSWAAFALELKDIRERERKTKAFQRTDTPTILPRGVLDGYGTLVPTGPFFGGSVRHPIPATAPLRARYHQNATNLGTLEFVGGTTDVGRRRVTDAAREALESIAPLDGVRGAYIFDRYKVLWRLTSVGGAYTELTDQVYVHPTLFPNAGKSWNGEGSGTVRYMRIENFVNGQTLPSDQDEVDIIVQYDGPVTPDWPVHLQGMTVGELLKDLYDGVYSDEDPRIRYNEAALLALGTPVLAQIEEPVDDLRDWAEKHCFPIAYSAPTLNADGEISPVTYLLPDATETLPDLNDANCAPMGGGWDQTVDDAINIVRVTYQREYGAATEEGSVIATREVTAEHRVSDSVALLGERILEVKSDLLTAIGDARGGPIFGDHRTEVGAQVAQNITRMATDRFALGGQRFALKGDRTEADIEALRPGSWTTVSVSWMPDYLTGTRGLARLAQVISRRNVDAAWCELVLVDAGSANAPLTAPTLGTITVDKDGVVSVPITALGSGGPDARVDYATGETEPAATSADWAWLARVNATGTVETPPQPPGTKVWVRARSEAVGRRPSAWTAARSVRVLDIPRVLDLQVAIDDEGTPIVFGTPNAAAAGVRLRFVLHDAGAIPVFPEVS